MKDALLATKTKLGISRLPKGKESVRLVQKFLQGRSPNAFANGVSFVLQIRDDEMSRQHFEIELTDDRLYLLNDLSSLNGTYVDGVSQKRTVLIGGSEIRAGKTSFIFTGV